jgi:UDP-glucose:(heptosyl)LPS alpha-1,3-glucosyltransferase
MLEHRLLSGPGGTRLMAFSNAVAQEVSRTCAPHQSRLITSPIGIDLERFHPAEEAADVRDTQPAAMRLRMLFAGHNFVLKGLPQVIAAMGRLHDQGLRVELAVAGRGDTAAMRRLARRARVEEAVTFLGSVPQDELAERYRSSDGLVHPSFYDPFPRSVLEAMACGCPVVTTTRCGTAELMTSGVQGWLVDDPRNLNALAAAIASLADRDRRRSMAAEAAKTARAFRFADHAELVRDWLAQPPLSGSHP